MTKNEKSEIKEKRVEAYGIRFSIERDGKEAARAAEFFRLGIHVIHEFIDQCDGDLFDLRFRVGHFADEDVTAGVDAAFGV